MTDMSYMHFGPKGESIATVSYRTRHGPETPRAGGWETKIFREMLQHLGPENPQTSWRHLPHERKWKNDHEKPCTKFMSVFFLKQKSNVSPLSTDKGLSTTGESTFNTLMSSFSFGRKRLIKCC